MQLKDPVLRRLSDRVAAASASRTPVEIRGGGTKAFYGGVPRGEPLDLRELAGILSYEPTELVITALAGTPLADVEAALESRGQYLPFEPPRFGVEGSLGGMIAAGLAGPARATVGGVRDHLLGVSVLNGRGETLTFGGQVMKNVAGYDVSRLFAGSMGILGVLCEVSLKVMPVSPACTTLGFSIEQAAALEQLHRWSGMPIPLSASAWYQGRLLVRLGGARAAVGDVRQRLGGAELDPSEALAWWSDLRDQRHGFFRFTPADLARGECLWRLSVPDVTPPLAVPGEQFIEWGGAQRWLRSKAPAPEIREAAARCGGHATLVRAADKSAGAFDAPAAVLMTVHRRLKQSFDPAGIFNPGRLYTEL